MTDTTATITKKQYIFDQMKIGSTFKLGRSVLESMTIERQEDLIEQNIIISLQAYVLTQKLIEDSYPVSFTHSWESPASWWQMFKEEVMPKWFTDRFPVQTVPTEITQSKNVKITRKATYPMANFNIKPGELSNRLGKPVIMDEVEII